MLMWLLVLRTMLAGSLLVITALTALGAPPTTIQQQPTGCWVPGKSPVAPKSDRILGRWYFPDRDSNIEIYRENGRYFARILSVSEATATAFGPMDNKILLTNLSFTKNEWSGGELIHPQTGNHFDVFLTLANDDTLRITAYKGCRLFNRTYTLVRV